MEIISLKLPIENRNSGCSFLHQHSVAETFPLHDHLDFYEIFFVLNGKAIHYINGENQLLTRGSIVLIRPHDIHRYESFNQHDFELISVGFLIPEFEDICSFMKLDMSAVNEGTLPPNIILDGYNYTDVRRKLLHIGLHNTDKERSLYFRAIIPFILYRILSNDSVQQNTLIPNRIRILLEAMSEQENFVMGLPRLIELSQTTQEHLTREFKKHIHMTPTEYINLKRMNYAAELLLTGEHEIIDICFMCGFNNLSHFYHIFNKIYNCSPRQFMHDHVESKEHS